MAKLNLEENNLYQSVKRLICKRIFEGIYEDGDLIPPERKLSEELGVSRVTIRKALDDLEKQKIIERIQGSGTRVALYLGPRRGSMEIITLVAPAQNEFFSKFIETFQTKADEEDCLVLYKQKPDGVSLEQCLYQIYEKGLRNIVLWKEDMSLEENTLRKLKGLGMNIVLFDTTEGGDYVDSVSMDNAAAIEYLYNQLQAEGCGAIGYIGWESAGIESLRTREETFLRLVPQGKLTHVPYCYHNHLQELPDQRMEEIFHEMDQCDSIIYAVGELGIVFENYARTKGICRKAAMVGTMPGAKTVGIHMIDQDFMRMSDQIFSCLKLQNQEDGGWKARAYKIKGVDV